jgi:hypothetical protein
VRNKGIGESEDGIETSEKWKRLAGGRRELRSDNKKK